MRPDEIRRWLQEQPFEPFRLHLTNGKSFEIRHPDQATVGRSTVIVPYSRARGGQHSYPKRDVTVALIHVTHLEPIAAGA